MPDGYNATDDGEAARVLRRLRQAQDPAPGFDGDGNPLPAGWDPQHPGKVTLPPAQRETPATPPVSGLPPGVELDQPQQTQSSGLPPGVELDQPPAGPIAPSRQAAFTNNVARGVIEGAKQGWGPGGESPEVTAANANIDRNFPAALAPVARGANWLYDNAMRPANAVMGGIAGGMNAIGGRDLAALPGAFMGSPEMLRTPEPVFPPDSGLRLELPPEEPPAPGPTPGPTPGPSGGPGGGPRPQPSAGPSPLNEPPPGPQASGPRPAPAPTAEPASAPVPASWQRGDTVKVINPDLGGEATGTFWGKQSDGKFWVDAGGERKLYVLDPATDRLTRVPQEPPAAPKPAAVEPEKPGTAVPKAEAKPGHEIIYDDNGTQARGILKATRKDGRLVVDPGDGRAYQFVKPDQVVGARVPEKLPDTQAEDLPPKDEPAAPAPKVRTPSQIQREDGVGYNEAVKRQEAEKQAATAEKPTAEAEKPAAEAPKPEQPVVKVEEPKIGETGTGEEVTHTTKRGRVLTGTIRHDLDADGARALDPFAFRKDGGWFIRVTPKGVQSHDAPKAQGDEDKKKPEAETAAPDDLTNANHGPWTAVGKNDQGETVWVNPQGRHAVAEDGLPWMEAPGTTDEQRAPRYTVVPDKAPGHAPAPKGSTPEQKSAWDTAHTLQKGDEVTQPDGTRFTIAGVTPGKKPLYQQEWPDGRTSFIGAHDIAPHLSGDEPWQVTRPGVGTVSASPLPTPETKPETEAKPATSGKSRIKPEQKPAAKTPEPKAAEPETIQGPFGDFGDYTRFSPEQRLVSESGRELSPLPKFPASTDNRSFARARRMIDEWLVNEAKAEAEAKGDRYLADITKGMDPKNFPPASRDTALDVLFGNDWGPEAKHHAKPKPEKLANSTPTEHPGLVIKTGDGKVTHVQPPGTVAPKPTVDGVRRVLTKADLDRFTRVPQSEITRAKFVLPNGDLLGADDEAHEFIADELGYGRGEDAIHALMDDTHAVRIGIAAALFDGSGDVAIRHPMTDRQAAVVADYINQHAEQTGGKPVGISYQDGFFEVRNGGEFRRKVATVPVKSPPEAAPSPEATPKDEAESDLIASLVHIADGGFVAPEMWDKLMLREVDGREAEEARFVFPSGDLIDSQDSYDHAGIANNIGLPLADFLDITRAVETHLAGEDDTDTPDVVIRQPMTPKQIAGVAKYIQARADEAPVLVNFRGDVFPVANGAEFKRELTTLQAQGDLLAYEPEADNRPRRPDGRVIPQVGDQVFNPDGVHGEVYGSSTRPRVRATDGKTFPLTPEWTVRGDPAFQPAAPAQPPEATPPAETPPPVMQSWAPEVFVEGKWSRNAVRFATEDEAKAYALDLFTRWTMANDHRAAEASEPVNYRWDRDKGLVAVEAEAATAPPGQTGPFPATGSDTDPLLVNNLVRLRDAYGPDGLLVRMIAQLLHERDQMPRDQDRTIRFPRLHEVAEQVYGGTLADNVFTRDRLYDALETGVNYFIAAQPARFAPTGDLEHAKAVAADLEDLKALLPTQTVRAGDKDTLQQFSTPPDYAFSAAWVANLQPNDRVLEPSAGTGGMAVHAMTAGVSEVIGNEISEQRRAMMASLPFSRITGENAEQLNNILADNITPTTVIMNPPFSSAGERMGGKMDTSIGATHIEQALKRLQPGGRLVAIVGRGMSMDAPTFRDWWKKIRSDYDVRANIGVGGGIYRKYGTNFGTRLLVFDKVRPSGRPVVEGDVQSASELLDALQGVRDDRPEGGFGQPVAGEPSSAPVAEGGALPGQPSGTIRHPTGGSRPGGRRGSAASANGTQPANSSGGQPTGTQPVGVGGVGSDAGDAAPVQQPQSHPAGGDEQPASGPGGGEQPGGSGGGGGSDTIRPDGSDLALAPSAAQVETGIIIPDQEHGGELTESVYEPYAPQRVAIEGAQPHPGALVQSAAMASVLPPVPTYNTSIPKKLIDEGALSNAQLEAIIYAGNAHQHMLPPTTAAGVTGPARRRGFFIGDGTGVGKGREVAGIILDNRQQGRRKAVWVSEKLPLSNDAKRDWSGLGQNAADILPHNKIKAGDAIKHDGILFTSYDTLKSGEKVKATDDQKPLKVGDRVSVATGVGVTRVPGTLVSKQRNDPGASESWNIKFDDGLYRVVEVRHITRADAMPKSRVQQIVDWLGADFDGVIAFDESHNMGNAVATKGNRGTKQAAAKALAGLELQKALPNARVVYVSATGATEVNNLAYADRLGLWGPGTAFADRDDFRSKVSAGGVAAMELVARDMKALGSYMARSLSYDGVEYDRILHPLTPLQHEMYDKIAEAWQVVLQNFMQALQTTEADGAGGPKAGVLSAFWGGHQRFFNQLITSLQMPSVIESVEKDIAAGRQAVLQLVNTNEAGQERALEKNRANGEEDLEDLDMSPRDQLMQLVEKAFPTQQYEEYADDEGNIRVRPVVDSEGRPVHNKEAIAAKEKLLDDLGSIRVPDGPLEILMDHFGADAVAEVTGRKQRVVKRPDPETGRLKAVLDKRGSDTNIVEAKAFQDGKKKILVFSQAGGTGRSYHAELSAPSADARRSHYLVQAGWRADTAVQGFGRTHRTNQASAPIFHLVTTDLEGQKRFISSIARRLGQLGALTKGERRTGDQGMFGLQDNLESDEAKAALTQLYRAIYAGDIEGITVDSVEQEMGLRLIDPTTGGLRADLPPMTQFLNRILSLKVAKQNHVFGEFAERFRDIVDRAAADGTLDAGTETYRADKITKQREQVVYTDPNSGAQTRHVHLISHTRNHPVDFETTLAGRSSLTGGRVPQFFVRNERTGNIQAVSETTFTKVEPNGQVTEHYRVSTPLDYRYVPKHTFDRAVGDTLKRIPDPAKAKELWDKKVAETPEFKKADLHLITGAVLPIWDRLGGQPKIYRLQTDAGERLLGRVVDNREIAATLQRLGAEGVRVEATPAEVIARVLDGAIATLANSWEIKRSRVANEWRLELRGADLWPHAGELAADGVFRERIAYDTRYFIPSGDNGPAVIEKITARRPIVSLTDPGGLPPGGLAESPVPLYSAVERAADGLKQVKGTGEQMLSMIQKTPGVKPEEMDWIGLPDWLRGQKSVTKQQIQDYVRANRLDVQEVTKGASHVDLASLEPEIRALGITMPLGNVSAKIIEDAGGSPDLVDRFYRAINLVPDATKYGSYALPGGADYREMLLTLPHEPPPHGQIEALPNGKFMVTSSGGIRDLFDTRAEAEAETRRLGAIFNRDVGAYKSGHWDEPNVVAHVRFDERTAPDGARVLMVQEVQSDWHQAGRKQGYRDNAALERRREAQRAEVDKAKARAAPFARAHAEAKAAAEAQLARDQAALDASQAAMDAAADAVYDARHAPLPGRMATIKAAQRHYEDLIAKHQSSFPDLFAAEAAERRAYRAAENAISEVARQQSELDRIAQPEHAVPDAPFKTSWPMLVMRRMVKFAVDHGFDRVAWSPGKVHAERYGLDAHISEIEYEAAQDDDGQPNGLYEIKAYGTTNQVVLHEDDVPLSRIEELIGGELAGKIKRGEGEPSGGVYRDWRSLSGVDLKVGGDGMAGFYDDILPKAVQKIVGRFGAKVGKGEVGDSRGREFVLRTLESMEQEALMGGEPARVIEQIQNLIFRSRDPNADLDAMVHGLDTGMRHRYDAMAQETAKHLRHAVHQFEITPQLRDAARADGMALFDAGDRTVFGRKPPAPPPAPPPLPPGARASRWVSGGGEDFIDLLHRAPSLGHDAASDWVVEQGIETGHEHLAVVDNRTGQIVHAGTNGKHNAVGFDHANTAGERDAYTLHHNHPSNSAISDVDVLFLANPGIGHVVAHTHNGHTTTVSLGPALIPPSQRTAANITANRQRLAAAMEPAERFAAQVMHFVIDKGDITRKNAVRYFTEVKNRLLHAAGVIDYVSDIVLPDPLHRALRAKLRNLGHADDMVNRYTHAVLPEERNGSLPQAMGAAQGRPGGQVGAGQGAGLSRPDGAQGPLNALTALFR